MTCWASVSLSLSPMTPQAAPAVVHNASATRAGRPALTATLPAPGSLEGQWLPGQILGAINGNQHRVALFFRVAILFGLDQPPPDLLIDRPGFVYFRGAIEARYATPRQHPLFAQRRLAEVDRQLAAVLHGVGRTARPALPQPDMFVVVHHRAAARGHLREAVGQYRAQQAHIGGKRGVDVRL